MKLKIIIIVFVASILSSCSITPFLKYYTTTKDGKFPNFSKRDYLAGSNNEYRSCYDILYYNLNIDVNPEKKYFDGNVSIVFQTTEQSKTILLDLHKEFKLDSIILNDTSNLNWKREGNLLFVKFEKQFEIDEQNELKIFYQGKVPKLLDKGPVHWKLDSCGNHWISSVTQGIGTYWIMPCKYLLSDEADSLRMNITVPKGLIAVGNGKLVNRKTTKEKETFEWLVKNQINVYNISINIGDFKHFEIPYTHDKETHMLQFYVLPYHYDIAKEYFKQCVDILNFYETVYDEYPWWDDGFKIIEASLGIGHGMEHQSAITLGLSYKNYFHDYSSLLIHEIAHEWWGNSVSMKDYGDLWLHEGFAVYNEWLFMEHAYGKKTYYKILNAYKTIIYNQRPVVKPMNVTYNSFVNNKDIDVYYKGAIFLHTLRYCINNDSLFFDILKTYYLKYKNNFVETSDFINHVNEKTNQDYNWLFNRYLYSHEIPELSYFKKQVSDDTTGKTILYYQWINTKSDFILPIDIISNSDTIKLLPSLELKSINLGKLDTLYFSENNGYINMIEKQ